METDILEELKVRARGLAIRYSIAEQPKLQKTDVDTDVFYSLISEFFDYNLSEFDIGFKDLGEIIKRAFSYFYDKGIESAINKHFNIDAELEYNQDDMLRLNEPDFPSSVTVYINHVALLQISDSLFKYIIDNKAKFDAEGYTVNDLCETILLIASELGVELATLIPLISNDFGIQKKINNSLKVETVNETSDMYEIIAPFVII